MSIFARRADVSFFYVGRLFRPVSTAFGQLKRTPKIVSCSTSQLPSNDAFIDAVRMETIGVQSKEGKAPITVRDVLVGMKTILPSSYKVPVSFEIADLPRRVRELFEETRKQHESTIMIASFDADPASKPLFVNSVELRIGRHVDGKQEEWLAQFIFSNSRLYTFMDRLRGFFTKK